jgi:hypothetical protein
VNETKLKVDLTKYAERHQFNFDEALDEHVSNDQVCLAAESMAAECVPVQTLMNEGFVSAPQHQSAVTKHHWTNHKHTLVRPLLTCGLQVYRVTVEPLVHTLFNNGKATCFAYGQTGSGKTFTMSPLPIRAAADILRYLQQPELRDVELFVSCFEIYGNKVFDLLNMRKKLNILEDGKKKVCVVGLKVSGVQSRGLQAWGGSMQGQCLQGWHEALPLMRTSKGDLGALTENSQTEQWQDCTPLLCCWLLVCRQHCSQATAWVSS